MLLNILLVIVLALCVIGGWKRGAILTLGRVVAAILAFLIAKNWSPLLGNLIGIVMPNRSGLTQLIAFIVILFVVERLISLLASLANVVLKIITSLPIISFLNKIIGAILGLAEGVIFFGSAIYMVMAGRLDPTLMSWISGSFIAGWIHFGFRYLMAYFL
ncbi:CvpA family protein [Candidatus Uhrbacteria bacterium]|nr:CvpA family protein [Candidatus Uhrbacteria bacterium]